MDELEKLKLELDSRGFSPKTKKSYTFFIGGFLEYANKDIQEMTEEDIKRYLSHLTINKKYTNITANQEK